MFASFSNPGSSPRNASAPPSNAPMQPSNLTQFAKRSSPFVDEPSVFNHETGPGSSITGQQAGRQPTEGAEGGHHHQPPRIDSDTFEIKASTLAGINSPICTAPDYVAKYAPLPHPRQREVEKFKFEVSKMKHMLVHSKVTMEQQRVAMEGKIAKLEGERDAWQSKYEVP